MQNSVFREEILSLSEGKSVAASNPLAKVSPFLDSKELVRVGGRLKHVFLALASDNPPKTSSWYKIAGGEAA